MRALRRTRTEGAGNNQEVTVPVIQCDIREGRTAEEKEALAQGITRVVHETIGAPLDYIYVLIRETPGAHHVKAGRPLPEFGTRQ